MRITSLGVNIEQGRWELSESVIGVSLVTVDGKSFTDADRCDAHVAMLCENKHRYDELKYLLTEKELKSLFKNVKILSKTMEEISTVSKNVVIQYTLSDTKAKRTFTYQQLEDVIVHILDSETDRTVEQAYFIELRD